jgi:hypothetical protein
MWPRHGQRKSLLSQLFCCCSKWLSLEPRRERNYSGAVYGSYLVTAIVWDSNTGFQCQSYRNSTRFRQGGHCERPNNIFHINRSRAELVTYILLITMNLIGNWQDSLKGGPQKQGLYLQMTTETRTYTCISIHSPRGIRAGDPSLRAVEDRARFRPDSLWDWTNNTFHISRRSDLMDRLVTERVSPSRPLWNYVVGMWIGLRWLSVLCKNWD